jgi:copper homeostasis protein
MPTTFVIEVCIEQKEDALVAEAAGASRIEINRQLSSDGLTASIEDCQWLKQHCRLPLIAMLRPHDRGFVYDTRTQHLLLDDCHALLASGVDGIACGALQADGKVEAGFLRKIARICENKELVMHRAFDQVTDQRASLEQLIDCGVSRVLTSGGAAHVEAGMDRLRELILWAGDRIEVLPGGGVNSGNAQRLMQSTNCGQLHGTFRDRNAQRICPDIHEIRKVRELADDWVQWKEQIGNGSRI